MAERNLENTMQVTKVTSYQCLLQCDCFNCCFKSYVQIKYRNQQIFENILDKKPTVIIPFILMIYGFYDW